MTPQWTRGRRKTAASAKHRDREGGPRTGEATPSTTQGATDHAETVVKKTTHWTTVATVSQSNAMHADVLDISHGSVQRTITGTIEPRLLAKKSAPDPLGP